MRDEHWKLETRNWKLFRRPVALLCLLALVGASVMAQGGGRVVGIISDEQGQPIKGATITAENARVSPSSFTTTSDEKGRFAMLGLSGGQWTVTALAPGFAPSQMSVLVSVVRPNPPVDFRLAKGASATPSLLAAVNPKDLQAQLSAADALYTAKKWDEAIAAYQAILTKAPALTSINLQIGNAYQMKKDYDKALVAYQEVLKADPTNEKAKTQIAAIQEIKK